MHSTRTRHPGGWGQSLRRRTAIDYDLRDKYGMNYNAIFLSFDHAFVRLPSLHRPNPQIPMGAWAKPCSYFVLLLPAGSTSTTLYSIWEQLHGTKSYPPTPHNTHKRLLHHACVTVPNLLLCFFLFTDRAEHNSKMFCLQRPQALMAQSLWRATHLESGKKHSMVTMMTWIWLPCYLTPTVKCFGSFRCAKPQNKTKTHADIFLPVLCTVSFAYRSLRTYRLFIGYFS